MLFSWRFASFGSIIAQKIRFVNNIFAAKVFTTKVCCAKIKTKAARKGRNTQRTRAKRGETETHEPEHR
jgi:hypothetical protein